MIAPYQELRQQVQRSHCRICEKRLNDDDDPIWALCEGCMKEKREFWMRIYAPLDVDAPPTGAVRYPKRD